MKKMMPNRIIPFGLLILLSNLGCGPDKETTIRAAVAERRATYISTALEQCRETMLQTAEKKVDSILLAEAQAAIRDSSMLSKPGKPLAPPPVLPIDSALVAPIFRDSGGR